MHRHEHGGRSSRHLISTDAVLDAIGVTPGQVILDVGCGDGYLSLAAAGRLGPLDQVLAADMDEPAIHRLEKEISARGVSSIRPLVADVRAHLPASDGTINTVIMANVLHGFVANRDLDAVMREVRRVLAVEGKLALIEFKKIEGPPGPDFVDRVSFEESEELIMPFGFERGAVFEPGRYHYGVVYIRR